MSPPTPSGRENETPPPFLGSWSRIYLLVAGLLAVETLAFWLLSKWAA